MQWNGRFGGLRLRRAFENLLNVNLIFGRSKGHLETWMVFYGLDVTTSRSYGGNCERVKGLVA